LNIRTATTIVIVFALAPLLRAAGKPAASFAPLEQWRVAVERGDASALLALYSTDPPAFSLGSGGNLVGAKDDVGKLALFHPSGMTAIKVELVKLVPLGENVREVFYQAELKVQSNSGPQTLYFSGQQVWLREKAGWRIVTSNRTALSKLRNPNSLSENLYPAGADAEKEIREAVAEAGKNHKRVLLVFGGNWCYDCHVLDLAFRQSDLAPLLKANYEVVHVDIGEYNKNLAIAQRYQVPLQKGVPAIAVLDSSGKLLFSQTHGEFENTRKLGPEDLIAFLNQWKPGSGNP
jgi:ketosteroid isomerase-like protein